MTENYFLYRHVRLDDYAPFYIGIGKSKLIAKTYTDYYGRAYNKTTRNTFWKNITSTTDYKVEILLESDDYEFIKKKEIEFIALYGRRDLGKGTLCNLTDGGEGRLNFKPSKDTMEKISKSYQANKENHKDMRGKNSPHAKRVIEIETGIIFNTLKEAAEYLGVSLKNFSNLLKNPHRKNTTGFRYLDDNLNKVYIDKSQNKKVYDYGTGEIIESISKASKIYNIRLNLLSEYLNGTVGNKTNLILYEDYLKGMKPQDKFTCKTLSKKVINTETGEVYNSIASAIKVSGLKKTTFRLKLTNKLKNNTPYMLLEEYNKLK